MVKSVEERPVRHLRLEEGDLDAGDGLHDSGHLEVLGGLFRDGCLVDERNLVDRIDVEAGPSGEEGVLHGDLPGDREDEPVVALLVKVVQTLVGDALVGLPHLCGVGDCEGVVLGTDLENDLHLALVIELLEGVEGSSVPVVDALEGDLEVADILELLDGDRFPCIDLLVEMDRLHHALYDLVDEKYGDECEQNAQNRFQYFVHYP